MMNTIYDTQNITLAEKLIMIIRENSKKESGKHLLNRVNNIIRWNQMTDIVTNSLADSNNGEYKNYKIEELLKCIVLEKIFNYSEYKLYVEVTEKENFRNFIGLNSSKEIPRVKIIASFRNFLEQKGLYNIIFNKFNEELLDAKSEILDYSKRIGEKVQIDLKGIETVSENLPESNIIGIEDRIRKLYEEKLSAILIGADFENAGDLKEKLLSIKTQIENLSDQKFDPASGEYKKLLDVENNLHNIGFITDDLEKIKMFKSESDDNHSEPDKKLYNKIINSFFHSLDENGTKTDDEITTKNADAENVISDKLKYVDKLINNLKDSLNSLFEIPVSKEKENLPEVTEEISKHEVIEKIIKDSDEEKEKEIVTEAIKIIEKGIQIHEPIVINPGLKKEGIFNDENLTEDYELGFRFHQLGLKTGFFNVKLDSHNESTRISTAEFFPNTFWGSVKQRSRWIAGICLQNWKAHKWKGNLTTKYFLFRDRKPLFSLLGAFLSNIIFIYLIYAVICNIFQIGNAVLLVKSSSVLWYLIVANLLFMISRATHRFVFTYNWYGFKFAFFSLSRLFVDTFVNFFAVLRAVKVFRQTKKKVVWDSTTHY